MAPRAETAIELCGIQVKGGDRTTLSLGGVDKDAKWKDYEISWLRSLNVPLFIATVDADFRTVDVYSTNPAVGVSWRSGQPYEVALTLQGTSAPITTCRVTRRWCRSVWRPRPALP